MAASTTTDEKSLENSNTTIDKPQNTPNTKINNHNNNENNKKDTDSNTKTTPIFNDNWKKYPTQRMEEVLVHSNKWLQLYFDKVKTVREFGDNSIKTANKYLEHRYNRIVLNNGVSGVCVIPINQKKEIGLINIFRYPVNSWSFEFPRGFGSNDINASISAKKELGEEMGVRIPKGKNMIYLGHLYENSGISQAKLEIYLALDVTPLPKAPESSVAAVESEIETNKENNVVNETDSKENKENKEIIDNTRQMAIYKQDSVVKLVHYEDEEQIEQKKLFVTYKEFQEMSLNGKIRDMITISAMHMAIMYDNTLFDTK